MAADAAGKDTRMRCTWKVSAYHGCRMPTRNPPAPMGEKDTPLIRDWMNEIVEAVDAYHKKLGDRCEADGNITKTESRGVVRVAKHHEWCYVRFETRQIVRGGKVLVENRITVGNPDVGCLNPVTVREAGRDIAVSIAQVVVAKARLIFAKEPRCKGRVVWDDDCPFFAEAVRRDDAWLAEEEKKARQAEIDANRARLEAMEKNFRRSKCPHEIGGRCAIHSRGCPYNSNGECKKSV